MLTDKEKIAISNYKYHQGKLQLVETLEGLWLQDFDNSVYPNLDIISGLKVYLNEAEPYIRALIKASESRQSHYEIFIKPDEIAMIRFEDLGHKYWREGMNVLAIEAKKTFDKWYGHHEKMFDKLISDNDKVLMYKEMKNNKIPPVKLSTKNVDFNSTKESSAIQRPKLSEAEKKRRKTIKKKEKKKEKRENELEKKLKEQREQVDLNKFKHEYETINILKQNYERFTAQGILKNTCLYPKNTFWSKYPQFHSDFISPPLIVGNNDEYVRIAWEYFNIFKTYDEVNDENPDKVYNHLDWQIISTVEDISNSFMICCLRRYFSNEMNLSNFGKNLNYALRYCMFRCKAKQLHHDIKILIEEIRLSGQKISEEQELDTIWKIMNEYYLDGWYIIATNTLNRLMRCCDDANCMKIQKSTAYIYVNDPKSCLVEPKDLNYVIKEFFTYSLIRKEYIETRTKFLKFAK